MKKTKFFLLALLCQYLFIQSALSQSQTPEDRFLEVVSDLDLTSVQQSTGIFYDQVPGYVPFPIFNGSTPNDSIFGSSSSVLMSYITLGKAYLSSNPLLDSDSIYQIHNSYKDGDTVNLSSIIYQYDRLKTTAIDDSLIYYDGLKFQHVNGAAASPFIKDTFVMLGGLKRVSNDQEVKFRLPSDLWTTNITNIDTISIDFGNGSGYQTLLLDTVYSIQYQTTDTFRIDIRFQMSNGDVKYASTKLEVKTSSNIWDRGLINELRTGTQYNNDPDNLIHIGTAGSGVNLHIWYNKECMDDKIRKPLILIKGFDPSDLIMPSFVMNGTDGLLDDDYDLNKNLRDFLHDTRRDIIFITMDNSIARIQDNAIPTKTAIEWINAQKAINGSHEKNIVIGASMGGLIGKWVLREFEMNGEDHETELFISYDSPLKGANIPLALQALPLVLGQQNILGLNLKDFKEELEDGFKAVTSPAARQMLYYYLGGCTSNCDEAFLFSEHDAFYQEFASRGNLDIPHVAITNGSMIGNGQLFGPNAQLIAADQFNSPFWLDIIESLHLILHVGNDWQIFVEGYALPGFPGSNGNIIGKHSLKLRKFGLLLFSNTKEISINPTGIINYDSAPGCLKEFETLDDGQSSGEQGWTYSSFCFIPTISSLDLPGSDPFADVSDIEQTLTSIPHIRSYIGSEDVGLYNGEQQVNMPHISLNNKLARNLISNISQHDLDYSTSLSNRTFNFSVASYSNSNPLDALISTRHLIDEDIIIENTGKVWINKDHKIAYIDEPNLQSDKSYFDVYIGKSYCDGNSTTVTVRNNGEIEIGETSQKVGELIIEETNTLIFDSNGRLIINDGSTLRVKSGAELVLKTGSDIVLKGNAKIKVDIGGSLVIEPNALISLEDGIQSVVNPDNGSRIEVFGELTLDGGNIRIQDEGYIWLASYSKINVINANKASISGHGKTNIALYVDGWDFPNGTGLDLNNLYVYLRNGTISVTSTQHSTIQNSKLESNNNQHTGDFNLSNSTFDLSNNDWINCTFNVSDCTGGRIVSNTMHVEFKKQCIKVQNIDAISIRGNCIFTASDPTYYPPGFERQAYTAIETDNLNQIYIRQSTFDGFKEHNIQKPIKGGSALKTITPTFALLEDVFINNSDFGIQGMMSGNIRLVGSIIDNTINGIYLNPIDNPNEDFGASTVEMICSSIKNTNTGIGGYDILLAIDAFNNAQSTDGEIRPNSFINNVSDFFIYYNSTDPINSLQARSNEWSHFNNYSLLQVGSNGTTYYNLDQSLPQSSPTCISWLIDPNDPEYCLYDAQTFPLTNSTNDTIINDDWCFGSMLCSTTDSIQQTYWEAFRASSKEEYVCAIDKFIELSKHSYQSNFESLGMACKQQIDIADAYKEVYYKQQDTFVINELLVEEVCGSESTISGISDSYMFVLDASASISSGEFSKMTQTVKKILNDYVSDGVNVTYAVAQFSGENEQLLSIDFTTDLSKIDTLSRVFSGLTDVTEGVIFAESQINSSTNQKARMIIFTDATKWQGDGLINYANSIKASSSKRDITIVRYQGSSSSEAESNSFYAAVSSKRGNYTGDVDNNLGDPEGQGPPRKFILGDYSGSIESVSNPVVENTSCDYLVLTNNDFCNQYTISWFSSGGGMILSDSTNTKYIRTNGIGSYLVEITCDSLCTIAETYNYETYQLSQRISNVGNNIFSDVGQKRNIILPDGSIQTPLDRENLLLNSDNELEESKTSIQVKPNPTTGLITVTGLLNNVRFTIVNQNGVIVKTGILRDNTIDLYALPSGLYTILFEDDSNIVKKVIKI